MFRLGYNTNGLAHHRVLDALELVAEIGYGGVALTPDVGPLDPLSPDRALLQAVRARAEALGLELAVETGARFVLDPRRKHFPTLLEESASDRARRVDFLFKSLEFASEVGAGLVSMWAGAAPDGSVADRRGAERRVDEGLWERLCEGVAAVLARGRELGVRLAFEPEPGMFIERPAGYLELVARLGPKAADLGLCLDVGHLLVSGDLPVGGVIQELAPRLVHVHLDDIAGGVHEHRMFGAGDLDLAETLSALIRVGYAGMAAVELSRDSHRGAWAAAEAWRRLQAALTAL